MQGHKHRRLTSGLCSPPTEESLEGLSIPWCHVFLMSLIWSVRSNQIWSPSVLKSIKEVMKCSGSQMGEIR